MSELIERARHIRNGLDIDQLNRAGIRRHREEYEFIVTYPALPAMQPISQDDVFSGEPREREVQFYTHIPFCTGTCTYCGRFQKFPRRRRQEVGEYIEYLERERELMGTVPELQRMKAGSLYIGGGTPTYLSQQQLERLTKYLTSQLDVLEGAEFTVEGSPETINRGKLDVMLANGVNRISIGVQSYHDDILNLCGRRHNVERAVNVSRLIRDAGFGNFNIDLMLGLPLQTPERWEEDLRSAASSGPTCVTVYPLYVAPGCEMSRLPDDMFPTEEDCLLMEIMAKEFFMDLGFQEDPVHFFASPGVVSQVQNIKKWEGREGIGIGISTYQFMNNTQYHNHFDTERYKASIDSGRLPIWVGKKLDVNEQMARTMVLGMKRGRVDKRAFNRRFGVSPEDVYPETMNRLQDLGLIEMDEDEVRVSYAGSLFSEEVAIHFLTDDSKAAYERVGSKYAGYYLTNLPDI